MGFIAAYILCKVFRNIEPKQNEWKDVFISLVVSLFSLLGAFVMLFYIIISSHSKSFNKPPKWL